MVKNAAIEFVLEALHFIEYGGYIVTLELRLKDLLKVYKFQRFTR